MFVKQIDKKQAMELAGKGHEIKVLVPTGPTSSWKDCETDTLQNLLEGMLFFRDEPAVPDPDFEKAIDTRETPTRQSKKRPIKKKAVDVGKIQALSNANWTQKEIAEEMKLSLATVNKYVRQNKEVQDGAADNRDDGAYL